MTDNEARVLAYITEHPGCLASDIPSRWGRASLGGTLIRLKEQGHILRVHDEEPRKPCTYWPTGRDT